METYIDFGVSYLIQIFVNKINTKLSNDVLFFKVDQNRATLPTLDTLLDHG